MQNTVYQRNKIQLVTIFNSLEKVTDYATRYVLFRPILRFRQKIKIPESD